VTPLLLLEGKQVTTLRGSGSRSAAPIHRAFTEEQAGAMRLLHRRNR